MKGCEICFLQSHLRMASLSHYRTLLAAFFWSSGSKIAATWTTYPFQVIRFHQQFPYLLEEDTEVEQRSTWKTFKLLVERKGYSGLFKGFRAHLQKSLVQNVFTLTIYETLSAARR
eukprot:Protomagalhaensia_wolfi_Nauph_80__4278@NODE_4368_length_585_cov_656_516484_g3487_i0_p1_GENE_NODE_4368_length_585_cov_656_516484_g3487_i0NODE_4368_length_585_cov_656_516484_g3487_i0_p1_ORF_typecomplete_len116_score10_02Mito_carr/PF00153_27/1_2e11_NODE_4368_length_585_cov_656_516484_g3487_i0104451